MKRAAAFPGARLFLACTALLCTAIAGAATGVPAWEQTFRRNLTGAGNQKPLAARELWDGSRMVVVIDNAGVSCVRYDTNGAVLSTATFYPAEGWPFGPQLAVIDPFGAVVLVTETDKSFLPFTRRGDIWTMKFDGLTGHELWPEAQTYASPGTWRDEPQRCELDPYGDVIVMGVTYGNGSLTEQVVLKYDGTTGLPSWAPIIEQTFSGTSAVDAAGDVYVSGRYPYPATGTVTTKYSGGTASPIWTTEGGQVAYPQIARVAAGRLVVSGVDYDGSPRVLRIESYDAATGAQLWSQPYGDPSSNDGKELLDLAVGAVGQVFLLAHTTQTYQFFTIRLSASNGAVEWGPVDLATSNLLPGYGTLRLTAGGDLLGAAVVYDSPDQTAQGWRQDGSSGVVSWGPVTSPNVSCCDPIAWFVAADGAVFYALAQYNLTDSDAVSFEREAGNGQIAGSTQTFTGAAGGSARLNDLTLDPAGDVIVTGNASGADGTAPWATIKYDHATGAPLWGRSFPTNGYAGVWPWQVLTDAAGNAIVAGYVDDGNGNSQLAVQKYAAADGATLWTFEGVPWFFAYGLSIDGGGNPAILGQVYNASMTGYDNALIKLSATDGHVLWGPVIFDSGFDDYPISLARDSAGNLVLTGLSYGDNPYSYVLKYSGATGAVLWGPKPVANARLNFVTVDPAGDPVVTGYQGQEMVTIKYHGNNGTVAWGPVHTPSSGDAATGFWATTNPSGDVFVAGPFWIDRGNNVYDYDVALTKFRGSDGSVLWGPVLYDGPSHLSDWTYSVVLDGSGNPVVAGTTEVTPRSWRVLALKYDGATGAALWSPVILGAPGIQNVVDGLAARGTSVYVGGIVGNAYATFALVETLGIATQAGDVPPGTCGASYDFPLVAANGTPGYSWSVISGALPPGVSLTAGGHLTGTPGGEGVFELRAQVQDSVGAIAQRDFVLTVGAPASIPIMAATDAACQTTLSVAGSWTAYEWLPGGETTPTIAVSPAETTTYAVLLTDAAGCTTGGEITVAGVASGAACVAPLVGAIAPDSGSSAGGASVVVSGSDFQTGAWLVIGPAAATGVSVAAKQISATTPALAAGQVHAVRVTNPGGRSGVLANGFFADFLDVDGAHPFHDFIESIVRAGITAGCGGGNYCPGAPVTRAQMAVFLLKAEHGAAYAPPACTGVFADVACPSTFADWIEQLANEGVTGGCGGGNYCPASPVTRAQMAVFLLKTLLGSSYTPPPATGIFGDVPPGSFAADWIEDLYGREITGGCSASPLLYCPDNSNTRGQMAVFLTKTFSLP